MDWEAAATAAEGWQRTNAKMPAVPINHWLPVIDCKCSLEESERKLEGINHVRSANFPGPLFAFRNEQKVVGVAEQGEPHLCTPGLYVCWWWWWW